MSQSTSCWDIVHDAHADRFEVQVGSYRDGHGRPPKGHVIQITHTGFTLLSRSGFRYDYDFDGAPDVTRV